MPVALPDGAIGAAALDALCEGFAAAHRRRYGFAADEEPVELVTFRIEATGRVRQATFPAHPPAGDDPQAALLGSREVWLPECGGFAATPVYHRERLRCANRVRGPAIVEQMDATTLVLPGRVAVVDPQLSLIVEAG
jgi:N-methylhydantoinase A